MKNLPESKYPPSLQATAKRIATTGRIVVGQLVPEPLIEEVEFRLFLAALGELMNDREPIPAPLTPSDLF